MSPHEQLSENGTSLVRDAAFCQLDESRQCPSHIAAVYYSRLLALMADGFYRLFLQDRQDHWFYGKPEALHDHCIKFCIFLPWL